ncbi:hypothetical protein K2173_001414 [Erythroxylum novogranatense]|uniref:Uncharacterized protein n=1 Tax=Erythroxylum novogranatense TaxID=1862640 RepID=A0AAV8S733_9ROSI|nr:hypothetical protein K2173_001414 [Erythroxylum novogranatense]
MALSTAKLKSDKKKLYDDNNQEGFVFVKDFRVDDNESVIQEAKSLNAIRTALENLEDQLRFFSYCTSPTAG